MYPGSDIALHLENKGSDALSEWDLFRHRNPVPSTTTTCAALQLFLLPQATILSPPVLQRSLRVVKSSSQLLFCRSLLLLFNVLFLKHTISTFGNGAMGDPAPAVANARRNVETATTQRKTAANVRYPFWFGGSAASMAAVVTHPLDLGTTVPVPSYLLL